MPRRSRIIAALALLLGLPLLFLTTGSVLVWCPVCGQRSSYSFTTAYGISLDTECEWRGPCLMAEHRPLPTSETRKLWWKKGYSHFTNRNRRLRYEDQTRLRPWINSPEATDSLRRAVLQALARASYEQLADLLLGPEPIDEGRMARWVARMDDD